MADTVLRVQDVGKKYTLRHESPVRGYVTLREKMAGGAVSLARRLTFGAGEKKPGRSREEFWALRNVSLEVGQGQAVGIVGRNGAGKSTLLKIVSRITEPSEGTIAISGRVSSLLEVGTGFHPELTGRENIYLNGAILGMTRTEIRQKFDEIVAFAEVEKFLDTPVKRFSSGMYVRLAFAVAAHLEPDVLIVDEVLAVGDVAFQKKCLRRMDDVAREGRTIIVVSHNMLIIEALCSKAIWLHAGKVMEEGPPRQVIAEYLRTSFSPTSERRWEDQATAPGNDEVRLYKASVRPTGGSTADAIVVTGPFVMEFEFWNLRAGAYLNAGIQLYNEHGVLLFESAPIEETAWLGRPFPKGLFRFTCHVPANLLNSGVHRVTLTIVKNDDVVLHKIKDIVVFEVADSPEKRAGWYGSWEGAVRPILAWDTQLMGTDDNAGLRA